MEVLEEEELVISGILRKFVPAVTTAPM